MGTTAWQPGSGRPCLVHSDENIEKMEDLVLSQEDKPKVHQSAGEISCETGILRSSVHRIIHCDLQLRCFKQRHAQLLSEANCIARLIR